MIVKHPRMIIYWHEYFINYRYVGDVSIAYRLQVTMAKRTRGPRRDEGVLGARRGAIISYHDGISEILCDDKFF